MKNFNRKNSIAERGGLMIEALAMLGLIAVVTPTMYKKSAERTMEVEDINTATTMRTIMGAAEAYMSSNYTDIMRVMEENEDGQVEVGEDGNKQTIGVLDVPLEDLSPYLPYKYSADNALYNYKEPTVRIVRSGDNLTAFALFPAKVKDGVGQERTVRIASLVGSNGGYVSKDSDNENSISAHGVGGVWSLGNDYYSKVFKDDEDALKANNYSIVTSSADVVNSSSGNGGGGDHPEFLLRYKKEGETWRNAMRTDLYMGEGPEYNQDGSMVKTELSSIRNINSLIVGTESSKGTALDGDSAKTLEEDSYGLYIAGSGATKDEGAGNAYIKGTILAAGNKLWASDTDLHYTGTNLTFDGTNFKLGKYGDGDKAAYIAEGKVSSGDGENATGNSLNIMGNLVQVNNNGGLGNYKNSNKKGTAKVAINTGSIDQNGNVNGIVPPQYGTGDNVDPQPDFGVDVADNMVVEGVLAAGQLDVNKIRTSNISVGSTNINDKYKWMDVDADGVHVHEPQEKGYKGTQIEAQSGTIAMRVGENNAITVDQDGKLSEDGLSHSNTSAEIIMNKTNGILAKTNGANLVLENSNVGIQMPNATSAINIGNITSDKVDSSKADSYDVNVQPGAEFNIFSGNLRVKNGDNPVLSVRGKGAMDGMLANGTGEDASVYNVAARGNAVFADSGDNVRYLSMGIGPDQKAAVNIMRGNLSNAAEAGAEASNSEKSRGIIYVDMDPSYSAAYFKGLDGAVDNTGNAGNQNTGTNYQIETTSADGQSTLKRTVGAGSIYIRKGLIDIVPDKSQVDRGLQNVTTKCTKKDSSGACVTSEITSYDYEQYKGYNADEGEGVVRASRFVANNVNHRGERVTVPDFYGDGRAVIANNSNNDYAGFGDTVFNAFNGKDNNGDDRVRYDTYMVNPAYTSVMNDIKLVSRGGARLSDILPTFITKGIYTAVNGAPEQQYRMGDNENEGGISIKSGILKLKKTDCPDSSPCLNIARDAGSVGENEPASPFIGTIPTPQCPPGYIRVIQVTPASIRMSEAGRIRGINEQANNYVDQYFGGMRFDVDDFTNPSNYIDLNINNADGTMAQQIYDMYKNAKVYQMTTKTGDTVERVDMKDWDVEAQESLDFEMASNPASDKCKEYNGDGSCKVYAKQFTANSKYVKNEDGGELMELNIASYNGHEPKNIHGGENAHEQTNKVEPREYDQIGSHADGAGVWREGAAAGQLSEGNIVAHDIHFKTPGLLVTTTNDEKQRVEKFVYSDDSNVRQGVDVTVKDEIDLSGRRLVVDSIKNVRVAPHRNTIRSHINDNDNVYVLTSKQKGLKPLTFQKSTWLKVDAVPLPWDDDTRAKPYTAGWAILMGFIYPAAGYQNVFDEIGFDNKKGRTDDAQDYRGTYHITDGFVDGVNGIQNQVVSTEKMYWNIYPVARSSLEAYITTYCYFEESDYAGNYNIPNYGDFPMVDRINTYTEDYVPSGENKIYRERLNDPSMKYNELW